MQDIIYFKFLPQICAKMNDSKFDFSTIFWGGLTELPLQIPPSCFLGFRPRFNLRPQFSAGALSLSYASSPTPFVHVQPRPVIICFCVNLSPLFAILSLSSLCPGDDAKLIRCVLGMTLNSIVVVQGMMVKLRPCLRFRACG